MAAFKAGDMVRIKDILGKTDCPERMRAYSGQTAHVVRILSYMYNGGEDKSYYELDVDHGNGLWPDYFLEPINSDKSDDEWIEQILKLIAEIEGKLDQLKRMLWRKKHYGK